MALADEIISTASPGGNKILLHAHEGWGKTSFAAQAEKPIFLTCESGLDRLIAQNQLPPTPHFPMLIDHRKAPAWEQIFPADEDKPGLLHKLVMQEHDFKTLVVDTADAFEQLLHNFLIERRYSGSFDKFNSYGAGVKASIPAWDRFQNALTSCATKANMDVYVLCHTTTELCKDPVTTQDYHRYVPSLSPALRGSMVGWADMVLFGTYDQRTEEGSNRATMGKQRILKTSSRPGWVAKHRHGLPDEIALPLTEGPKAAFQLLMTEITKGKTNAANGR